MLDIQSANAHQSRALRIFIVGLSAFLWSPAWGQADALPSGATSVADVKFCGQWEMTEAFFNAHPEQRERAERVPRLPAEANRVGSHGSGVGGP